MHARRSLVGATNHSNIHDQHDNECAAAQCDALEQRKGLITARKLAKPAQTPCGCCKITARHTPGDSNSEAEAAVHRNVQQHALLPVHALVQAAPVRHLGGQAVRWPPQRDKGRLCSARARRCTQHAEEHVILLPCLDRSTKLHGRLVRGSERDGSAAFAAH